MKKKLILAMPLLLGLLSVISFIIYMYSANHAPYSYTYIIIVGPICSLAGVIFSIVNRKSRITNETLWVSGLIACSLGLILSLFILIVLLLIGFDTTAVT